MNHEGVDRRRFLVGAMGALVAGVAGVSTFVARRGDGGRAGSSTGVSRAPAATSTAPPQPALTRATVPAVDDPSMLLPEPERPPADAFAEVPVREIGRIAIPRIDLDHAVYEGVWLTVLNVGPGHWPGSAMPGQAGNTVFPGHRVTYSRPFYRLDELVPGDDITFTMANGSFTYAVRETLIVSPKDLWVVDQREHREATLIACHPRHSARQRIVVKGRLVRSLPNVAAAAAAEEIAAAALSIPL